MPLRIAALSCELHGFYSLSTSLQACFLDWKFTCREEAPAVLRGCTGVEAPGVRAGTVPHEPAGSFCGALLGARPPHSPKPPHLSNASRAPEVFISVSWELVCLFSSVRLQLNRGRECRGSVRVWSPIMSTREDLTTGLRFHVPQVPPCAC